MREKILLEELFFYLSRISSKSISPYWQENFSRVAKTAYYVTIKNIWGQLFLENNLLFYHLWPLRKKKWPFVVFFSVEMSKLNSTCPWKNFSEIFLFFFKKNSCLSFVTFGLWAIYFCIFVKIVLAFSSKIHSVPTADAPL